MKKFWIGLACLAATSGAYSGRAQAADAHANVWTEKNELRLPAGYRQWVYLGSPITPEGLNDNKAGFPEFHNVYIPADVLDQFKKTGEYPEGSIFVKELQLTLPPAENADGSRTEVSGADISPASSTVSTS